MGMAPYSRWRSAQYLDDGDGRRVGDLRDRRQHRPYAKIDGVNPLGGPGKADRLAGEASSVRTAATHVEFSYQTHRSILHEVMSLVGGIERLFPQIDGPSRTPGRAKAKAQPRRRRRKKRRLCDVPLGPAL